MTIIHLDYIEFRFVESWIFEYSTFVSMIYRGENYFDRFFANLNDVLKKSLYAKMKIIGQTHRSNWNSTIIETLKNYPKQYCIRKLGTNNFRVSTTTIDNVIILILGFPKDSDRVLNFV